jgi:hypothetical protein
MILHIQSRGRPKALPATSLSPHECVDERERRRRHEASGVVEAVTLADGDLRIAPLRKNTPEFVHSEVVEVGSERGTWMSATCSIIRRVFDGLPSGARLWDLMEPV